MAASVVTRPVLRLRKLPTAVPARSEASHGGVKIRWQGQARKPVTASTMPPKRRIRPPPFVSPHQSDEVGVQQCDQMRLYAPGVHRRDFLVFIPRVQETTCFVG